MHTFLLNFFSFFKDKNINKINMLHKRFLYIEYLH